MFGFCRFLVGMGYPAGSITNPGDGTYTFSCYESSEKIAGCIAWYYEREGLRPMIVGHKSRRIAYKVWHLRGKCSLNTMRAQMLALERHYNNASCLCFLLVLGLRSP